MVTQKVPDPDPQPNLTGQDLGEASAGLDPVFTENFDILCITDSFALP